MFRLFSDKKTFLGFAIICLLFGSGGLGSTQQTAPSAANADQENISDGELRAFVKAYVDNQKIRQKYNHRSRTTRTRKRIGRFKSEPTQICKNRSLNRI
jgi:hypothetical protein